MNVRCNAFAAGCSLAFAVALQSGCATAPKTTSATPQTTQQTQPQTAQQTQPQTTPQDVPQVLAGKVVETMNSGGYTYINLENNGKKTWVAVPPMKVEVGQEVKLLPGMEMGKFTSSTLKRTFDSIIFSSGPVVDSATKQQGGLPKVDPTAKLPEGHPVLGQKQQMPQGHPALDAKSAAAPAANAGGGISGKVVETMDGGGYTYVNVEKDGKKTWVAIPVTPVTVGSEIELQPGAVIANFSSKTLKRTFDSVVFSGGIVTK